MDIINLILALVGLVGGPTIVIFLRERLVLWFYLHWGNEERVREIVARMVGRYACKYPDIRNCGTYSEVPVAYFIDLLTAVNDRKEREKMERALTRWIGLANNDLGGAGRNIDKVAVPKLGNVLLGDVMARRLRKPLIVVRQEDSQYVTPGHKYDGRMVAGDKVLLVDDVTSDDEFIMRCVRNIQSGGGEVVGCVGLVDRKEGLCLETLMRASIPFAPILRVSDIEIEALRLDNSVQ